MNAWREDFANMYVCAGKAGTFALFSLAFSASISTSEASPLNAIGRKVSKERPERVPW